MTETTYQWRTAIADPHGDDVVVRGYNLGDLMESTDFVSTMYLVLTDNLPTPPQREMLNMMLVAVIDHGISPSSSVTRTVAASGVPLQACVASGLLTIGDIQGGAGEEFARGLADAVATNTHSSWDALADEIIAERRRAKRRIDGFGHPQHPEGDPRAPRLIGRAQSLGVAGDHVALALALEAALERSIGRRIAMNVDGALGSVMLDLGIGWRHARTLCITSRSVGLAAHAVEEVERERGWRGVPLDTVLYDGEQARAVPAGYLAGASPTDTP